MMKKQKILVIGAGGQLGTELTQGLWDRYGKDQVMATDLHEPQGILTQGNFEILDALNQTQLHHYVLDAAVEFKLERVYWPSSIAAFGPTTPKLNTPQHTIMDPTTIYGISKFAGERWCDWYFRNKGVDVRSLRYPGLIGYKSKPGGGTTDYAVDIFFKALTDKKYTCFLKEDTYLPMMYMDDAVKATLDLMEAPSDKIKIRSSYNISAMSFCPGDIAEEIKKHIPDFTITYEPDFRQGIADSWPKSIDDSSARKDWGWKHAFDLSAMTEEILQHLPALLAQEVEK